MVASKEWEIRGRAVTSLTSQITLTISEAWGMCKFDQTIKEEIRKGRRRKRTKERVNEE